MALVPCPATLHLVQSRLAALPRSCLPTDLSNYLRAWGGKEKGKAEMDTWEEKREESCKEYMDGEEEEGVTRHGGNKV